MSLITAATSIMNMWIGYMVNTGDRAMDQSIHMFLTLITSLIISNICINYKNYYNTIVYILWKVWKDPMQLDGIPIWSTGKKEMLDNIDGRYKHKQIKSNIEFIIPFKPVYMTMRNIYYIECIDCTFSSLKKEIMICIYGPNNAEFDITFNNICNYLNINNTKKTDTKQSLNIYKVDFKSSTHLIVGNISPRKTFDTLFYDQKEYLLNILTAFKNGTMYPASISMDNKLGILLYGPPGTGKTGTISAIANMLKRDLFIVDCSSLTTTQSFDIVMNTATKSLKPNPIIVFDEFDCILNVLTNPAKSSESFQDRSEVKEKWSELLAVAEGDERKEILKMIRESKQPDKDTPLDLGYILSKLDGLEENTDRLIIATTNNPDKLNPALMRPGRFDLKLCLGNCSQQMLVNILGAFFNCTDAEKETIRMATIPEFKYSPLTVINKALICKTLEKTLEELKQD